MCVCVPSGGQELSHAQIADLDHVLVGQEHVRRLEVAAEHGTPDGLCVAMDGSTLTTAN